MYIRFKRKDKTLVMEKIEKIWFTTWDLFINNNVFSFRSEEEAKQAFENLCNAIAGGRTLFREEELH